MQKKRSVIGNSLGLVIDEPVLALLRIDRDTMLDVSTDGDALIIRPLREAKDERLRAAALRQLDSAALATSQRNSATQAGRECTRYRLWDIVCAACMRRSPHTRQLPSSGCSRLHFNYRTESGLGSLLSFCLFECNSMHGLLLYFFCVHSS